MEKQLQIKRTPLYVCFDPVTISFYATPLTPTVGKNYTTIRLRSHRSPHRSIVFKFPNSLLRKRDIKTENLINTLKEKEIAIKFHLNHIEYVDDRVLPEDIEIFVVNILPPETAVGEMILEELGVGVHYAELAHAFWRCKTDKEYYFAKKDYHNACVQIRNARLLLQAKIKLNPPKYTKFKVVTKEREFTLTVLEPRSKTEVANMFLDEYPKKIIPLD